MPHKSLVRGFLKNAKHMLTSDGEIHFTYHKTMQSFNLWNITKLAQKEGLVLVREEKFDQHQGYNIIKGDGSKRDETFYVGEMSIFMFACVKFNDKIKKEDKMSDGIEKDKKKKVLKTR